MTRAARPSRQLIAPGAGLGSGSGSFSRAVGSPAPAVTRQRIHCTGEICVACDLPIYGVGERLTRDILTTHAHLGCSSRPRWEFA